jgi:MinD-like ATPase involved in chromosome partitioning or flagellar assembly
MEKKHNLVIIDTDYEFVRGIEEDLIRRYADSVDVQILTDQACIDEYFSRKRTIDVLIIDQNNYGEYLSEHAIRQTFLMIPEIALDREIPANVRPMVKYLPKEELFRAISDTFARFDSEGSLDPGREKRVTHVIAVFSPIGGCGKSLVSIGLARKLTKLDKKVLLVGCDDVQSFAAYYDVHDFAEDRLAKKLREPDADTYWIVMQNIGSDEFHYLKPFSRVPHALGVGRTQWGPFITMMREKKDYDYIVLDIGSRVDEASRALMDRSDVVVMVTEPNVMATRKMLRISGDSDMLPAKKCYIISNQYHSDGMRFAEDAVFDQLSAYVSWRSALEDPMFYRLALNITEMWKQETDIGEPES